MTEALHEEALRALRDVFEDRIKQRLAQRRPVWEEEPDAEDHLAFVLPMSAEEVGLLAEVAERYSVPLVALGARTSPGLEPSAEKGSILVRFDLMRRTRLPADFEEPWVEAEPGVVWLELDNDLHARGRGLAVYPTSASRATVGGWLAMDGLGVGSFEYGWLRENVLSASVVLPGGERREVPGGDLRSFVGPEGSAGIVVSAKLRTRRADADVPFAIAVSDVDALLGAVVSVTEAGAPLWHLAFLNPELARARGLGENYLLFGAYSREREVKVDEGLQGVLETYDGRVLPTAEAYRVWGERFFPVAPAHPVPRVAREFVSVAELSEALGSVRNRHEHAATQGTISRAGEVLLLSFDVCAEGWIG